jgi:hypothetical protein
MEKGCIANDAAFSMRDAQRGQRDPCQRQTINEFLTLRRCESLASLRAKRSNPEATKEDWIASSLRSSQ